MKMPWENKTGLAKIATILATTLGIAVGLCGLNAIGFSSLGNSGLQSPLIVTAYLEMLIMILSVVGLLIVALIAIVIAIRDHFTHD
jgi:hypothetical protein